MAAFNLANLVFKDIFLTKDVRWYEYTDLTETRGDLTGNNYYTGSWDAALTFRSGDIVKVFGSDGDAIMVIGSFNVSGGPPPANVHLLYNF